MTAPTIATMRLQMLRPVTPVIPKMPEKIRPPTIAPTMPRTMSMIMPEPVLFTILLPNMIPADQAGFRNRFKRIRPARIGLSRSRTSQQGWLDGEHDPASAAVGDERL